MPQLGASLPMQTQRPALPPHAPRRRNSRLTPVLDFIGASALIAVTALQMIVLFQTINFSPAISALIVISAALNLSGLFISVAYQRVVFTITFFFTLVFFSLAPMQQLIHHFDPVMSDPWVLARAFGFCLVFSAICLIALLMMRPAHVSKSQAAEPFSQNFSSGACTLLFGLLCATLCTGVIGFGRGLFTDRTTYSSLLRAENSQPVMLLYTGALRPFAVYGSIVGLWLSWSHRRIGWLVAFCLTLAGGFLLANPLITPRFEVAALGCATVFYFSGCRRCRFLVSALLAGIALSPLFNLFRSLDVSIEYGDTGSFLVSMDYDAFSLLCHTIWHVDYYGLDYGKNIISAIFFFVPRALWPAKNEITPYYLLDSLQAFRGLWNTNLSEPLIAEGYFAFGFTGVVTITLVYVWFARFLETRTDDNRLNSIYLFCCAAPPLLFILLRGSLIVGVSVVVGHLLAIIIAVKIATMRFMTQPKSRQIGLRELGAQSAIQKEDDLRNISAKNLSPGVHSKKPFFTSIGHSGP